MDEKEMEKQIMQLHKAVRALAAVQRTTANMNDKAINGLMREAYRDLGMSFV
ncbi:MAG: hypothetical protein ABIH41_00765 [Nanoarchaeota archaeon]